MISKKIAQQVKELEIHTRRILSGTSIGGSKSRQRGFGFEFDQLRGYQYGDDVRLIDWKSSARSVDSLLVRQYFEERNRVFMICLDISASTLFGSGDMIKQDMMKQITGVLSLAAEYGKDKVGLILFSDRIEKVVHPAKGKAHVHAIIETIFSHQPQGKRTDLAVLFEHVAGKVDKHAIVFVVSDFIASDYEKALRQVVVHKEVIAISCADKQETDLAPVGLVWMLDSETNECVLVDARKKNQGVMQEVLHGRLFFQKKMFHKHKVDFVHIQSKQHFVHDLIMFFQKRLVY